MKLPTRRLVAASTLFGSIVVLFLVLNAFAFGCGEFKAEMVPVLDEYEVGEIHVWIVTAPMWQELTLIPDAGTFERAYDWRACLVLGLLIG